MLNVIMVAHVSGFVCGLAAVLGATIFTLYCYGNIRKQHVIVTLATLIAWYFSFIIVFILPLDVSATTYNQCIKDCNSSPSALPTSSPSVVTTLNTTHGRNTLALTTEVTDHAVADNLLLPTTKAACSCVKPWSSLPDGVLLMFWKIVYWSSQVLTWLVLPLMQSYANAGEFSVLGKLKSVIIANLILYGTYAVIFCICLIYVATRPNITIDSEYLKVIGITASNTWGLFLLVLLYGYGLVDIPRSMWQSSNIFYTLQQTYFKVAKISMECSEAQEKYEDTLEEVRRAAEVIKYNHAYRKYIDTILSKCPEDFTRSLRRNDDYVDYNEQETHLPTEKALIKMHINVITTVRNYNRTQSQQKTLVQKAFSLEDDIANQSSSNKYYKRSSGKYEGYLRLIHSPWLEWWWRIVIKSLLLKAFAVLLAIFSAMVVWSECFFFISSPVLSIFAQFIRLGREHFAYISIEIISILVLSYLCVCAYRTVFKIRVFNYYYVALNHQTDENSLLFSGTLLSRLTPPLCLNFLSLIQLDSHVTKVDSLEQTSYTKIMGHMDVISFIANGFNIYFPIAIVLLCIATAFRLGSRLLHCIGFEQFIDDDISQELVDEGRNLVQREKLQGERNRTRVERRANWDKTIAGSQIAADRSAPTEKSKVYKGRSSKHRQDDQVELLSDQDAVEYDPTNVHDGDLQTSHSTRTKPSTRIFDDI